MLNPWMLLGLLGLAVPVIIHLIHRQRLQPRLLATLKFLEKTDVSNAFALAPRDILQLLLRLLLLGLFVLLMARLTVGSRQMGTRAMGVVLDQSMSMQRKLPGGRSLFARQKEEIGKLIDGMQEDDQMSLVLVGDEVAARTGFLRDKGKLKKALAGFRVSEGGGRGLFGAIRQSVDELRTLREPNTCVIVFSDQQRSNYASHAGEKALGASLRGSRVKLLLIAPDLPPKPNVAIDTASFSPARVYLGTSSKITARVRNLSDEAQDVEVGFSEGDKAGEMRPLKLAARETATIDLAHGFESASDAACRVEISDDVLPADNVFHAPMRVRDQRQVLIVSPAQSEMEQDVRASAAGVDLLGYALNPGEALGTGLGTHIRTKRVTSNLLERLSLPLYSTIVLYGVTEIPGKTAVADLSAYVENGGGVYIIPDAGVNPVQFNEQFARLLGGLQLGSMKEPSEPVFLDKNEAAVGVGVLAPMLREEWGDVEDVSFRTYAGLVSLGKARVALRGKNGDPLAVVVGLGRGHVYVQTFSCDVADSSAPRSPVFVPMVQEIVRFLGTQDDETDTDIIRVNEVARMRVPELRSVKGRVELRGPVKSVAKLDAARPGELRVEGIRTAGNYRVFHAAKKGMRPRWLGVNPVRGESDLTPLAAGDYGSVFGKENVQGLHFAELGSRFARRRELFPLLAVLLFIAFVIEAVNGARLSLRRGGTDDE